MKYAVVNSNNEVINNIEIEAADIENFVIPGCVLIPCQNIKTTKFTRYNKRTKKFYVPSDIAKREHRKLVDREKKLIAENIEASKADTDTILYLLIEKIINARIITKSNLPIEVKTWFDTRKTALENINILETSSPPANPVEDEE